MCGVGAVTITLPPPDGGFPNTPDSAPVESAEEVEPQDCGNPEPCQLPGSSPALPILPILLAGLLDLGDDTPLPPPRLGLLDPL